MELIQKMIADTQTSTISGLYLEGGFLFFIIEDGYRRIKERGETRIPPGRYELIPRRYGPHFEKYKNRYGHKFAIELVSVPNFSDILIHVGNTVKDTEGCLLTNYATGLNTTDMVFFGADSAKAYCDLYDILEPVFESKTRVFLTIER